MSEPAPVLVITLGAPDRADEQPPCEAQSAPLPVTPELYIRVTCTLASEHGGPHLWAWTWADIEEPEASDLGLGRTE